MSGNKALKRALGTSDAIRVNAPVPLITDTTELITPEIAREMLKKNKKNRPINWKKVEEYAAVMKVGNWKLHAQGIILDVDGNILTGQKRLWAVVYAGVAVYFRVSRGNPPETATLIDRGTPQTARDLAARNTERRHSPTEASIARAAAVLMGVPKPSVDDLATIMSKEADIVSRIMKDTSGTKKTRSVIMIIGAILFHADGNIELASQLAARISQYAARLDEKLAPETADKCWGKGAAFSLAMKQALEVIGG